MNVFEVVKENVTARQAAEAYVLHCMSGNTTKVKNIKKYLLAALFNAPSTMNGYYQAEVNHDMPGLVR